MECGSRASSTLNGGLTPNTGSLLKPPAPRNHPGALPDPSLNEQSQGHCVERRQARRSDRAGPEVATSRPQILNGHRSPVGKLKRHAVGSRDVATGAPSTANGVRWRAFGREKLPGLHGDRPERTAMTLLSRPPPGVTVPGT